MGCPATSHAADLSGGGDPPAILRGYGMESTVYAGELTGIRMALHKLRKEQTSATVFVDSQAAIQAVRSPQRPSGQYILGQTYYIVRRYGMWDRIQIRWIPALIETAGNEMADEAAREGTQRTGEAICLAAAAKRKIRRGIKDRWALGWKTGKTGRTTHKLIEIPNEKILDFYRGLSKPHTSIIIQMQTQRNGLKHFLFKLSGSDQCSCGQGSQTSRHILLQCPLFIEPRKVMLNNLEPKIRGKMDYNGIWNRDHGVGLEPKSKRKGVMSSSLGIPQNHLNTHIKPTLKAIWDTVSNIHCIAPISCASDPSFIYKPSSKIHRIEALYG
ncbi:unnamed protein product [Aspergillus oryzae]|nr:unnamed protein product [Aspergillus oryzae]